MARLTPGTRVRVTGYNCSSRYSRKMLPVGSEHVVNAYGLVTKPKSDDGKYVYEKSGYSTDPTFCNHVFEILPAQQEQTAATKPSYKGRLSEGTIVRVIGYLPTQFPLTDPMPIGTVATVNDCGSVIYQSRNFATDPGYAFHHFEIVTDEPTQTVAQSVASESIPDEKVTVKDVLRFVHDRLVSSKTSQNKELLAPMRFAYVELIEQVFGITADDLETFDRVAKILA